MTKTTPKMIAWFLPIAYLVHLIDEYFSGEGFSNWFSGIFKVSLSPNDFIIINSIGFTATVVIAILYGFNKVNHFIIALLGSLFFTNGLVHIAASVLTEAYSPGTFTGIIIYLPLGFIIFKKIFPLISQQQRLLAVAAGVTVQIFVATVALNI